MNAHRRTASRRGFPDNLYQKADGYYWYRNPQTGKSKGIGHDRAYAFRAARNANDVLASKDGSSLVDWVLGGESKTLAVWAEEYETIYTETRSPASNTLIQVRSNLRGIKAAGIAKQLRAIKSMNMAKFITEMATTRGPWAAQHTRAILIDVFREVKTRGHTEAGKSPVKVVRNPKAVVKRDRLSLEQFLDIREQASGWLVNAMNLAILSGQRRENIAKVKFSDSRDGYWYLERGNPKMELRIPMSLWLNTVSLRIADVVKQCRMNVATYFLIYQPNTYWNATARAKISLSDISDQFADAKERVRSQQQYGKTPLTFHEIRPLSERLFEKEYDGGFTQKLLGYKAPKMTAVYRDVRGWEWINVAVGCIRFGQMLEDRVPLFIYRGILIPFRH